MRTTLLIITALLGLSLSLLFRWQGLSLSLGCQEADRFRSGLPVVDAEQIVKAWKGKPVVVGWLRVTNVTWSGNVLEVAGQPAKARRWSDKNRREYHAFTHSHIVRRPTRRLLVIIWHPPSCPYGATGICLGTMRINVALRVTGILVNACHSKCCPNG
jgi:hypothetical protein